MPTLRPLALATCAAFDFSRSFTCAAKGSLFADGRRSWPSGDGDATLVRAVPAAEVSKDRFDGDASSGDGTYDDKVEVEVA